MEIRVKERKERETGEHVSVMVNVHCTPSSQSSSEQSLHYTEHNVGEQ